MSHTQVPVDVLKWLKLEQVKGVVVTVAVVVVVNGVVVAVVVGGVVEGVAVTFITAGVGPEEKNIVVTVAITQ